MRLLDMHDLSAEEIFEQLKELLCVGNVIVKFKKVDGSLRTMCCTLVEGSYVGIHEFDDDGIPRTKNPDILTVWDLEIDEWRSIRKGTIVSVEFNTEVKKKEDLK